MERIVDDVAAFHLACDVPICYKPKIPPIARKELRIALIDEEVNKELIPALRADNLVLIADALADSIYVIVGTALEYGIPLETVWALVQQSNMAKINPLTGKVTKRADGKVLKPEGWQPPDIANLFRQFGWKDESDV